jgi:ubiquinone biosynthesis accessory factor UbiK
MHDPLNKAGYIVFAGARRAALAPSDKLVHRSGRMAITVDKNDFLNDLQDKLRQVLAGSPAAEIERNIKAVVAAQLAKFELVTREEFDTQKELLLRLRERAAELEARVAQLEGQPPAA